MSEDKKIVNVDELDEKSPLLINPMDLLKDSSVYTGGRDC